MSIAHRIGWRRVCVSHAHALTASRALMAQARLETAALAQDLAQEEGAEPTSALSEDSASSARDLVLTLTALNAIGWPHQHAAR